MKKIYIFIILMLLIINTVIALVDEKPLQYDSTYFNNTTHYKLFVIDTITNDTSWIDGSGFHGMPADDADSLGHQPPSYYLNNTNDTFTFLSGNTFEVIDTAGNRKTVILNNMIYSYNFTEDSGYYDIYDNGIAFYDYTTQLNSVALLRGGLTLDTFRIYDNVGIVCSLTTPSNMEWFRHFSLRGNNIYSIGSAFGDITSFGLGSFDSLKSVIFAEIDTIRDSVYIPKLKSNSIYTTYINSDSVSIDSIFNIEYLTPKNDTLWLPYNNTIAIGGQAGSGDSVWGYFGHNFTSIEDFGWQIQDSFGNEVLAKSDLFYIRDLTDVYKTTPVNISRHWFAYRTYVVRYPYDGYYYFDIDTSSYMRRLDTFRIVNKDLPDSLSNCRLEYKQGAFTIADTLDSLTYTNGNLAVSGNVSGDTLTLGGANIYNTGSWIYFIDKGVYTAQKSGFYGLTYMKQIVNRGTYPLTMSYGYAGDDSIQFVLGDLGIINDGDTAMCVDSFNYVYFPKYVYALSRLYVGNNYFYDAGTSIFTSYLSGNGYDTDGYVRVKYLENHINNPIIIYPFQTTNDTNALLWYAYKNSADTMLKVDTLNNITWMKNVTFQKNITVNDTATINILNVDSLYVNWSNITGGGSIGDTLYTHYWKDTLITDSIIFEWHNKNDSIIAYIDSFNQFNFNYKTLFHDTVKVDFLSHGDSSEITMDLAHCHHLDVDTFHYMSLHPIFRFTPPDRTYYTTGAWLSDTDYQISYWVIGYGSASLEYSRFTTQVFSYAIAYNDTIYKMFANKHDSCIIFRYRIYGTPDSCKIFISYENQNNAAGGVYDTLMDWTSIDVTTTGWHVIYFGVADIYDTLAVINPAKSFLTVNVYNSGTTEGVVMDELRIITKGYKE